MPEVSHGGKTFCAFQKTGGETLKSNHLKKRPLIIGSNGGVARALLSLLEKSQAGQDFYENVEMLYLVDQNPQTEPLSLPRCQTLEPKKIQSEEDLSSLIKKFNITEVIDLSSLDTIDCIQVCDDLGVHLLSTSVEEWPESPFVPTDQATYKLILTKKKNNLEKGHIVGSGANPGIVNALVEKGFYNFLEKVEGAESIEDLDIQSILITEKDTTKSPSLSFSEKMFPMTWSPEHCLEELFEPRAFFAKSGEAYSLEHSPTAHLYRAICGDEWIEGMAVPHEETLTLSKKYRNIRFAFIYDIPSFAKKALLRRPKKKNTEQWDTLTLCPTHIEDLVGYDRLGVLFTSKKFGEFWMGYETTMERGLKFGVNATQLQVAAGVLAGWKQLNQSTGLRFVEDLDSKAYLNTVDQVLGSPKSFFYPNHSPKLFKDRKTSYEEFRA